MEYKNILLNTEDGIALITINRPKSLNALNTETLKDLKNCIDYVKNNDKIKVVIITGSGEKAFVAGADISEMENMSSAEAKRFSEFGQQVFREIELLEKPVIAAVNGFALGGGCELSMACDIRYASMNAKFGQPEINLGIIPGFSGTQRLARLVGRSKAKEMIFTGDMIKADEALNIGLVSKVVEKEELLNEAKKLANKIMSKGLVAISMAKESINLGIETDIESGNRIESNAFSVCFSTMDQKEGMKAFLEKRAPKFENR